MQTGLLNNLSNSATAAVAGEAFRFPAQRDLYALWCDKRGTRKLPPWSSFDPVELRRWLGNLNLLDVVDGGKDFRYRVHGTTIAAKVGADMTGRLVSQWHEPFRSEAFYTYGKVVAAAAPFLVRDCESLGDYYFLHYRLVLPLSDNGETVDRLLTLLTLTDTRVQAGPVEMVKLP
jgi:hypothetical protein